MVKCKVWTARTQHLCVIFLRGKVVLFCLIFMIWKSKNVQIFVSKWQFFKNLPTCAFLSSCNPIKGDQEGSSAFGTIRSVEIVKNRPIEKWDLHKSNIKTRTIRTMGLFRKLDIFQILLGNAETEISQNLSQFANDIPEMDWQIWHTRSQNVRQ